jgi:MFS family permease
MLSGSRLPVRRLWTAVLLGYLALGATLQALPSFVTDRFGQGSLVAGTAVGIAFLATACTRPFAGRAADAGRARPVVMTGGVLGALGGLGHLLAPNIAVLLLSRIVMGAGEAALLSGAIPWVLADTPVERRGRTAGWFGLSMWGGLAAGPLVAVALESRGGFSSVWYGVVALGVAAALLVAVMPSQQRDDRPPVLPSGWREIVPAGASLPGLVLGLSAYGYGTISALLLLYLRHDGLGGDRIALAVFAAAFLLARVLGSPLVDRWGGDRVAFGFLVVQGAGLLLVALASHLGVALVGTVLAGVGLALMYPAAVALTLHRTGPLRPGTSVGVMTSFWDLGIMIAGPLGGWIAAESAYPVPFGLAVAASAVAALLVAALLRLRPSPAAPARLRSGAATRLREAETAVEHEPSVPPRGGR